MPHKEFKDKMHKLGIKDVNPDITSASEPAQLIEPEIRLNERQLPDLKGVNFGDKVFLYIEARVSEKREAETFDPGESTMFELTLESATLMTEAEARGA